MDNIIKQKNELIKKKLEIELQIQELEIKAGNYTKLNQVLADLNDPTYRKQLINEIQQSIYKHWQWQGYFNGTEIDGCLIRISQYYNKIKITIEFINENMCCLIDRHYYYVNNFDECLDCIKTLCTNGINNNISQYSKEYIER